MRPFGATKVVPTSRGSKFSTLLSGIMASLLSVVLVFILLKVLPVALVEERFHISAEPLRAQLQNVGVVNIAEQVFTLTVLD